jgi:hypothetical protein
MPGQITLKPNIYKYLREREKKPTLICVVSFLSFSKNIYIGNNTALTKLTSLYMLRLYKKTYNIFKI